MRTFYLHLMEKGPDTILAWVLFLLLWPLGLLYRFIVWTRIQAYTVGFLKSYRASVPVISVGNITAGGTGKTPVVDAMVKYLSAHGRQVAVVSRGYKGTYQEEWCHVKADDPVSALKVGDEPFLLASRNPEVMVYVARKRRYGVVAAEVNGADCIVLDDAFQHLAVSRDLDVVLIDARKPFGNGSLIPAGSLREPRSALERADLILLTHSEKAKGQIFPDKQTVNCRHHLADYLESLAGERYSWEQVSAKRCMAFAGIADTTGFFSALSERGCELVTTMQLDDHQIYTKDVLSKINQGGQDVDLLLTTQKDAVKLSAGDFDKPCLVVPLEIKFDDFSLVTERLNQLVGGPRA